MNEVWTEAPSQGLATFVINYVWMIESDCTGEPPGLPEGSAPLTTPSDGTQIGFCKAGLTFSTINATTFVFRARQAR